MSVEALRLVLGDQLTLDRGALRGADAAHDVVLMIEARDEATYVRHHKKKIAYVLAAMRAFAEELGNRGFRVDYIRLNDPQNTHTLSSELSRAVVRCKPKRVVACEAGEYRLLSAQRQWSQLLGVPVDLMADDRFLCSRAEFETWAGETRHLRMEYFYRLMRRKTGILMDGDAPVGGRWNLDADNRKRAPTGSIWPAPPRFSPSAQTQEVLELVGAQFGDHFGDLAPFWMPVSRTDAEAAAQSFFDDRLAAFGDHQDAMLRGEKFLAHSLLSAPLNLGLLDPLDLCRRAENEYRAGRAPLNAAEGFIRQILGWREFVRGVYWRHMPNYTHSNSLCADRSLPDFYWTGETDMTCLAQAISQTKSDAYAHHIQRLMVTGNFAMLAGVDPTAVHEWYLSVYLDAFEWVEAPNTIGMSQHADGGIVGSKPYAASGAYINRMSDYCGVCRYDVRKRAGPEACPFNALYWDFLERHRDRFAANPRMAQMYRTYDRLSANDRAQLHSSARAFLAHLDRHGTDRTA